MYRLFLFSIYLILGACSDSSIPVGVNTDESGEISVVIKLSKKAAASLTRAEVVISAADMNEISQDLTINGDTVTGTVEDIPAGNNRLFTLNGYESDGNLIYSGSASADVIAGQQIAVRITMRRLSSQLGSPQLSIRSSASAQRPTYEGVTTITGEIENNGSVDATNVAIDLRARNESGAAVSDARASIGIVRKGESKLFTDSFNGTCYSDNQFGCPAIFVVRADYTITYSEGDPIEGTITVQ